MRGERAKRAPNATHIVISARGAGQERSKRFKYSNVSAGGRANRARNATNIIISARGAGLQSGAKVERSWSDVGANWSEEVFENVIFCEV